MIIEFEKEICEKLISIYENRYNNGSKFTRKISIKFDENGYRKYVDEEAYKYRDEINDAVKQAEKSGFISVTYEKGTKETDIFEVCLNLNNIEAIYKFLGKMSLDCKFKTFFETLSKIDTPIADAFVKSLKNKRETNGTLMHFINKSNEYIDALKAIHAINKNSQDIYMRNLSVKLFHDSKRLETLKNFIIDILKFVNEDDITWEEYLFLNGVLKNPNYIFLKGKCKLRINEQELDLSKLKTSTALCSDSIKITTFISIENNIVTTIENLTTFHNYENTGLIIYLGGFSNHSKVELLKKLNSDINGISFSHFGDMDFGGFSILSHLRRKTNLTILPLNMDINTIKERIELVKKPKSSYILKLKNLLNDEYLRDCYNTLQFMIDNQIILEQESY